MIFNDFNRIFLDFLRSNPKKEMLFLFLQVIYFEI